MHISPCQRYSISTSAHPGQLLRRGDEVGFTRGVAGHEELAAAVVDLGHALDQQPARLPSVGHEHEIADREAR